MKETTVPTTRHVLLEQFLKPSGLSQNALARDIGVPPRRINEIILGKRGITADTALRLAKHFGIRRATGWACRRISTSRRREETMDPRKASKTRYLTEVQVRAHGED